MKKKVGVICGGTSSEREISLKSAKTIVDNFPDSYEAIRIVLNESGWFVELGSELLPFDLNNLTFMESGVSVSFDFFIVYIHGDPGENGKIQAFLDLMGARYLNSSPLASALSFDKWYCNQFLKNFGYAVAESIFLTKNSRYDISAIIEKLGLPLFVKPTDSGSSFGISKVKKQEELSSAIDFAFKEGNTIVIEAFLDGKEVTCGVYRNEDGIVALPLTEIASENEFFDYDAKYNGKSKEITPARVDDTTRLKVQAKAKAIYELIGLRSIARIDFMVVDREPIVIEVNTTPGFSPASIVPQMLACDGKAIRDFWSEIIKAEFNK